MKRNPDKTANIVALREAGWSLSAIACREDMSVSTVQRVLRSHPAKKGAIKAALIEAARQDLAASFAESSGLSRLHTELVADTVAQVTMARMKAGELLEALDPANPALGMRALAAHSTAIKNHADTLRLLLPQPESNEELPTLAVVQLTEEEVRAIIEDQAHETGETAIDVT